MMDTPSMYHGIYFFYENKKYSPLEGRKMRVNSCK